ncbi:MAG: gliding motility-associated C-terminal domain-containing protein [Saprospiraceae bacterium]|nr:gliding motility-associated C-terminal domain-containing protein [Saprospiraceae bacterium]
MKNYTLISILILMTFGFTCAQTPSWQALIEVDSFIEVPLCQAVSSGVGQIPSSVVNRADYRTRLLLKDTIFVNNSFILEARILNNEMVGGLPAFDPGVYLDGCSVGAGVSMMGADWALPFTSMYAGTSFAGALPQFVQDFSDWRILRYVFRDNVFYIFFDNQLVHSLPYTGSLDFITEILVRFKGSGMVDWLKLYDENAMEIWSEEFTDCNNMRPFPDIPQQTSFAIASDTIVCKNESLQIAASANVPATYAWTGPNGFSSDDPNFTLSNINNQDTGFYYVTAQFVGCIEWRDSVYVGVFPEEIPQTNFLGNDTTLCPSATLSLGRAYSCATYLWQDGSSDSTFIADSPGVYSVQVNIDGILYRDSIQVSYFLLPMVNLGKDTTLCPGGTLLLDATFPTFASYRWQDGSSNSTFTVNANGIYNVTITDACGNSFSDTIKVDYFQLLKLLDLGNDTTLCPGQLLSLNAMDNAAISYLWQDGSTAPTFTANAMGVYFVTIEDNCGNSLTDSIELEYFKLVQSVNLGKDTTLCPGEIVMLDATNDAAATYRWQDGSDAPIFSVQQPGTYTISISDHCGNTVNDAIEVAYFQVLRMLDLGKDTSLCPGTSIQLNAIDPAAISYRWQDSTTSGELLVNEPGIYSVTLSDNCGNTLGDSIEITYYQLITSFDLGNDTTLCVGNTHLLDVTTDAAEFYLWQDGSTKSGFLVDRPGIYSVVIGDHCGNEATDLIKIRFEDLPTADLGADTTVCEGMVYRLDAGKKNATYYFWQDGSVESSYPVTRPGPYSVVVGNQCGFNNYSVRVDFEYCGPCRSVVPTAFSPNGDNINDLLEVFSECVFTNYDFRVFDRWGSQVFTSNNPSVFWEGTLNGRLLPSGVYIWRLIYEAEDGSSATLSGDCTLLR